MLVYMAMLATGCSDSIEIRQLVFSRYHQNIDREYEEQR